MLEGDDAGHAKTSCYVVVATNARLPGSLCGGGTRNRTASAMSVLQAQAGIEYQLGRVSGGREESFSEHRAVILDWLDAAGTFSVVPSA